MLSYILNMGSIATISEKPMDSNEQGFSGAAVIRLDVVFNDGRKGSFIGKKAELKERMAMQTLTEQGHLYTPAAYSENLVSDEPMWMIQQDLGKRVHAPYGDQKWMENVAEALVEIHGSNMNRGEEMPWLPHADANYWKKIVTQISVDHFERAVCIEGKPYIIDFGFVRYAPFYIDLVDYFSFENVALYYKALTARGFSLNWKDFEERFRTAFRYPCFIYMFPGIMKWRNGSEEQLLRLLHRIFDY